MSRASAYLLQCCIRIRYSLFPEQCTFQTQKGFYLSTSSLSQQGVSKFFLQQVKPVLSASHQSTKLTNAPSPRLQKDRPVCFPQVQPGKCQRSLQRCKICQHWSHLSLKIHMLSLGISMGRKDVQFFFVNISKPPNYTVPRKPRLNAWDLSTTYSYSTNRPTIAGRLCFYFTTNLRHTESNL